MIIYTLKSAQCISLRESWQVTMKYELLIYITHSTYNIQHAADEINHLPDLHVHDQNHLFPSTDLPDTQLISGQELKDRNLWGRQ